MKHVDAGRNTNTPQQPAKHNTKNSNTSGGKIEFDHYLNNLKNRYMTAMTAKES